MLKLQRRIEQLKVEMESCKSYTDAVLVEKKILALEYAISVLSE